MVTSPTPPVLDSPKPRLEALAKPLPRPTRHRARTDESLLARFFLVPRLACQRSREGGKARIESSHKQRPSEGAVCPDGALLLPFPPLLSKPGSLPYVGYRHVDLVDYLARRLCSRGRSPGAYPERLSRGGTSSLGPADGDVARFREEVARLSADVARLQEEQRFR